MEIRTYRDTDEQAVVDLWRKTFPNAPEWNDPYTDIQLKLSEQPELFFVALVGERLVGTAMAGFDGHRGWVYYLAVDHDYQRRGIGRALMYEVEQALRARGCPKLNLQIRSSNHAVREFYERLGYASEDRISMAKRLHKTPYNPQ
jgi:ribosomal protein S18 acetylase RimI-like enzyme